MVDNIYLFKINRYQTLAAKKIYLLLFFACMSVLVHGQITPLADQFLINPFLTNPALTGTSIESPLSISARQQWLGFRGAPSWQSATFHSGLQARKQRFNPRGFLNKGVNAFGFVGLGGGLFSVKYGAISQVGLHIDYAYHVHFGKGKLSFGLAPMYQQYVINKSGFLPPDGHTPDPVIDGTVKEMVHFIDANAGVHYLSKKYFAGFSVVQLLNSSVSFGDLSFSSLGEFSDNPYLARSLYLYGGRIFAIGKKLLLEPSVLGKYSEQDGFRFHVNMKATINETFEAGLLYRFRESAGFFAGIRVGDLFFRYQFEAPVGTDVSSKFTNNQVLAGYLFRLAD